MFVLAYLRLCLHVRVCLVRACMYVCVCVLACVCVCVRPCVCFWVLAYIHACMHAFVYVFVRVRVRFTPAHLVKFPVAVRRGDVELQHVLVHGEVDVGVDPLQRDMVPVLVVQEAAQGHLPLGLGGHRGPAPPWSPGGGWGSVRKICASSVYIFPPPFVF